MTQTSLATTSGGYLEVESLSGPASVWATVAWPVLVAGYAVLSTVWTGHDPGRRVVHPFGR